MKDSDIIWPEALDWKQASGSFDSISDSMTILFVERPGPNYHHILFDDALYTVSALVDPDSGKVIGLHIDGVLFPLMFLGIPKEVKSIFAQLLGWPDWATDDPDLSSSHE